MSISNSANLQNPSRVLSTQTLNIRARSEIISENGSYEEASHASVSFVSSSPKADNNAWTTWNPIPDGVEPPDIPIEIIPVAFRAAVADIVERMCVPVGFVFVPLIIAWGSIVGRQIGVRPKRVDDWYEVPNLWGATIGAPGSMKSPAADEGLRALLHLDKLEIAHHSSEMQEYKNRVLTAQSVIKRHSKRLEAAILPADSVQIAQDVCEAQRVIDAAPKRKRLVINDSTSEQLGVLLQSNPNGILELRDELTGWIQQLDKIGREGSRSFYIEGWNGKNKYTVERVGREPVDIPALCVSIFGTTQLGPARDLVSDALKGGASDDGLLQRFQLLFVCTSPPRWINVDRQPDHLASQRVQKLFNRAEKMDTSTINMGDAAIPTLRFAAQAQLMFDAWREQLEDRLRDGSEIPAFVAYLSKTRKTVTTLALLFYLTEILDVAVDGAPIPKSEGISGSAFIAAVAFAEILQEHARWLYDPKCFPANQFAKRIRDHDIRDGMTLRQIERKHWAGLTPRENLDRAIEVLMLAGWVRVEEQATIGRSRLILRVHPDFRGHT